jgi:hypothetical protein
MSHAGSDAVFDFRRVCPHDVWFTFGVRTPGPPQDAPPNRLRAMYMRIQVASPPPARVDKLPWEFGIRVNDGTEDGRPLQVASDDSWKHAGVFHVTGIPSLDQPPPGDIVADEWLTVPAAKATMEFTDEVDPRGFLSASYPQPELDGGVAQVPLDFYVEHHTRWPDPLPPQSWLAISFDRFWPPERESVEYIAQVGECDPPHDQGG